LIFNRIPSLDHSH